jgi:N-glycosylase/DNA lyase
LESGQDSGRLVGKTGQELIYPTFVNLILKGAGMADINLQLPLPISLVDTVNSHGWVHLAPWNWDSDRRELSRPECIYGSNVFTVTVNQSTLTEVDIRIGGQAVNDLLAERAPSLVRRWISITWDPSDAINIAEVMDARIAQLLADGGGRFLRSSTFYEDFVKTICTVNTNWSSTKRMVTLLVEEIGNGVFPTPLMIADCGEAALRQRCKLGFRSPVLMNATTELLSENVISDSGDLRPGGISYQELLSIRGIGPYSASHVAMLEHDFSHIPVDSEVSKYCEEKYLLKPDQVAGFFESWGDYRFLGYKLSRILDQRNWIGI